MLVERYATDAPVAVRFRVPSWEAALADIPGHPTKLLSEPSVTSPCAEQHFRALGDRVVTRELVVGACHTVDTADDAAVISAFVLVMAWGSGTSNGRSLRNTRTALANVSTAATTLRASAIALRATKQVDDPVIAEIHREFSLPGIGEAFFTKWFAFAGYTPDRYWQPLILDSRVRRTLHKTLDVWLNRLTDIHRAPERYAAYVIALHRWAYALPKPVTATQLEWILFAHNGGEV